MGSPPAPWGSQIIPRRRGVTPHRECVTPRWPSGVVTSRSDLGLSGTVDCRVPLSCGVSHRIEVDSPWPSPIAPGSADAYDFHPTLISVSRVPAGQPGNGGKYYVK